MKISIGVGGPASGRRRDWQDVVTYVTEAESLGVDCAWSAEAWGPASGLQELAPGSTVEEEARMSKRDQNKLEQKERILASARALFSAEGFDEVTMADIARRAGVARATVFNYFSSKHALIDAITEEVLGYYGRMLDRALELEDTPTPALLRSLFEDMGTGIEQVQQFYRGVFREIAKMQLGLDEGGAAARERDLCVGRLAALMARGQARGELSRVHDPSDLAYAFDSLSNGTIIHWLYDDTTKSLSDRMLRAVEIFLRSVSVPDEPRAEGPLPDLAAPVPVAVQDLPQAGTEWSSS